MGTQFITEIWFPTSLFLDPNPFILAMLAVLFCHACIPHNCAASWSPSSILARRPDNQPLVDPCRHTLQTHQPLSILEQLHWQLIIISNHLVRLWFLYTSTMIRAIQWQESHRIYRFFLCWGNAKRNLSVTFPSKMRLWLRMSLPTVGWQLSWAVVESNKHFRTSHKHHYIRSPWYQETRPCHQRWCLGTT